MTRPRKFILKFARRAFPLSSVLFLISVTSLHAQTTQTGPLPYTLPSCTAKDAGSVSVSNVQVVGICDSPNSTVDVSFDYSFFTNSNRYDFRLGLTTPDAGVEKVFLQGCAHTLLGVAPDNPPNATAGSSIFDNIDGDNDCGDVYSTTPGTAGSVSFTVSCDPLGKGFVDTNLQVSPALDWVQRTGDNKGWQFEAPKCKLGDADGLARFTIPTGASIASISKVSNGGTGTFGYALSNAEINSATGGSSSSITTTAAGVPATDGIEFLVQDLSQPIVLSETVPLGWEVGEIKCTKADGSAVGAFSAATASLTIPGNILALGDELSCTITNSLPSDPTLTLQKQVVNDDGGASAPSDWTLTATGPSTLSGISGVSGTVAAGNYSLSESGPLGYTQTNLACSGAADNNLADGLTLTSGETVTCTFTNDDDAGNAMFDLVKSTASNPSDAGDTLIYDFAVLNTGGVNISGVTVTDAKCAVAPSLQSESITADGLLEPGETQMYKCTSVAVTQAEVDAGSVSNTASVSGTPASGTLSPVQDTETTPITAAPSLSLVKSSTSTPTVAGDTLVYTFDVANTGNVTIATPVVTDAKCATAISRISGDSDGDGALDVGETHRFQCSSLPVTQAEVDAGSVDNAASASGTPAGGTLTPAPDTLSVSIAPAPGLTLDKRLQAGGRTKFDAPNQVIDFDFVVTNTGNVTLTSAISIADPDLDAAATCPPLPVGGLAPGASLTCTGRLTVDQTDIDNGGITNTASASSGTTNSPSDSVTVGADQMAGLTVDKVATDPSSFAPGQSVSYTYTVRNTGNTTIPDSRTISVSDNRTMVNCPAIPGGGLAPNATLVCTASYAITAGDITLGTVTNTATATDGTTTSPIDSATVPANFAPALSLTKVATAPAPAIFASAGEQITYTYTIRNSGGASFGETITVSDDKINGGAPFDCWVPSGPSDTLDPDPNYGTNAPPTNINGETAQCTSTYSVSQDDVDAGSVTNQAVAATVFAPGGANIPVASPPASETVTSTAVASLIVAKSASPADLTTVAAGDVITYTITVTNSGEITLDDVAAIDPGPAFNGAAATNALSSFTLTTGTDTNSDGKADTLAPGDIAVFQATYVLTQADIDNAAAAADPLVAIANTASATATPRTGTLAPVTAAGATTGFRPEPAFTVVKQTASTPRAAGDTLSYSFVVENTGNVSITGVTPSDSKCAAAPILASGDLNSNAILEVTEVWTFTCTSVAVTQAEIDAGSVDNTVTVSGTPSGGTLADATDMLSTSVAAMPGFDLVKSTASTPAAAGDTLIYDFAVSNTGNVSILNVAVGDAKCSAAPTLQSGDSDTDGELDPTETWMLSCTSVAVTQAEVDGGQVDNSALLDGDLPGGGSVPQDSSSISTPIAANPVLSVVKSTTSSPAAAGDTLSYSFAIGNGGNVSVGNVQVSDPKCAAAPILQSGDANTDNALNPNETWIYSCSSIAVTQAEVDAGVINNTVTVSGEDPSGNPVPDASDTNMTSVVPAPGIEALKTVTAGPTIVGGVVIFDITVENTGNVTLSSIGVTDALTNFDGSTLVLASGPAFQSATLGSSAGTLLPGEIATYQASYVLTQADIDAGGIRNSATVTGSPPTGAPVTDLSDDGVPNNGSDNPTELPVAAAPAITLAKALAQVNLLGGGTGSSFSSVGDVVDYTFTVENTGNVTLTDPFTVNDPLISGAGGSVTCQSPPLAPGATLACAGSYTITQIDLDAGTLRNTATVTDGNITSAPATETVSAIQTPSLSMTKTAQAVPPANFVVGAVISYDYIITNDGNVTVTSPITISDNLIAPADITCPAWPGSLAPGSTYTCQGSYAVTSDDVDLGVATNIAVGTDGSATSPPVSESVPDGAVPALSIAKSTASVGFAAVGDTLSYSFDVANAGTRAFVQPINVEDDLIGTVICWTPTTGDPDFTAGETATCGGVYSVTQADLDRGFVRNNAFARTTFGGGTDVVSAPDAVTVNANANPMMTLTKQVTLPGGRTTATLVPGDTLTYTLEIENTGNQTLASISASDPLIGLNCTVATLNVGATDSSCAGTYTVTQADIDTGSVDNSATASGSDPSGGTVVADDTLSTPMPAATATLNVTKTATPDPFGAVGSTITYAISVENTGNVTVSGITVSDPLLPSLSCSIASLAPSVTDGTCSGVYTVTQADVDAGSISNTATASGLDPNNTPVSDDGSITTSGPAAAPGLEATKTFSASGTTPGSVVTFTIRVENTGNVSLRNVVSTDTLTRFDATPLALDGSGLSLVSGDGDADAELDVTEVWIFEGTYTLIQADIDAGGLRNIAVVDAADPNGTPVSDTADDGDDADGNTTDDPTEFPILSGPQIEAEKVVASTTGSAVGDTVTFNIRVRNTGNVTLNTVTFVDTLTRADGTVLALTTPAALIAGDTTNPGNLDVGETWIYAATYDLVQADIDAGGIENTVTVSALDPSSSAITDVSDDSDDSDGNSTNDPTAFSIAPAPGIEAEKTVVTAANAIGQTIGYQITVQNTGNVTLSGVGITDTLTRNDGTVLALTTGPTFTSATSGSPSGTLLPGETAIYSASYMLVQDDIDAGGLSNQVLATGTSPSGAALSDLSDDPLAATDTGPSDPTQSVFTQTADITLTKSVQSETTLFPTVYRAVFQLTAENTGNVTQTGISLQDDLTAFAAPASVQSVAVTASGFFGAGANSGYDGVADVELLAPGASLAPGATGTILLTVDYSTAAGFPAPGINTLTGVTNESPSPTPSTASVANADSDGDGVPDGLESANNDRDGDGIPDASDYDPTGYFYCEEDGRLLTGAQITVSGSGFSQTGVGTTGPVTVVADGTGGFYQFFVSAAGTYTLSYSAPTGGVASAAVTATTGPTDVTTLVDVATGTATTNPRVLGSSEFGATGRLADFSPAANPAFYTTFVVEAGDPFILSNNIPFRACTPTDVLTATKAVLGRSEVRIGDLVTYQIDFTLGAAGGALAGVQIVDIMPMGISYVPGTASISPNGAAAVATEPVVSGRRLSWSGQAIPSGGTLSVVLSGRVMPNAPTGRLTNEAYALDAAGAHISNSASATVERVPEHVFDCSDVIGTVFDDRDMDGYQDGPSRPLRGLVEADVYDSSGKAGRAAAENDDYEPGIPGVRVVTVRGTRITTDEFGRFHVPCAELPSDIGTNFILKVDERSLPSGYRMTTENPRVVRLTAGKFAKMNFGAALSRVIEINLADKAFTSDGAPSPRLAKAVSGLIAKMQGQPSTIRLTYVLAEGGSRSEARRRLRSVEKLIRSGWRERGTYRLSVERLIRNRWPRDKR